MNMKKIIMVDDDTHLTSLTKVVLTKNGYAVTTLHDGVNIVEEVRKYGPDLILMDFMMPQVSGAEAVKLLRREKDLKDIPVVFLTGLISGNENEASLGVNIEGDIYPSMGKPFEIEHLLYIVAAALKKGRG